MFRARLCLAESLRMNCGYSSVRGFITENSCSYVLLNKGAECSIALGIKLNVIKRVNCADSTESYYAFSLPFHCSSLSSVNICTSAVFTLTANKLRSNLELFFCASKLLKLHANPVQSARNLTAKSCFGNTVTLTRPNVIWQQ